LKEDQYSYKSSRYSRAKSEHRYNKTIQQMNMQKANSFTKQPGPFNPEVMTEKDKVEAKQKLDAYHQLFSKGTLGSN